MCELAIVRLSDSYPDALCVYLLVKFIIFCAFGGFAVINMACAPRVDRVFVGGLWATALSFELVAAVLSVVYTVWMVAFAVETLANAFVCCCPCWVFPLATRPLPTSENFAATLLVASACTKCCKGLAERDGPAATVLEATRCGMAMV